MFFFSVLQPLFVSSHFQPDNTVEPFFTTLVREANGKLNDIFAVQLCGPNLNKQTPIVDESEAEVAGTMVNICAGSNSKS